MGVLQWLDDFLFPKGYERRPRTNSGTQSLTQRLSRPLKNAGKVSHAAEHGLDQAFDHHKAMLKNEESRLKQEFNDEQSLHQLYQAKMQSYEHLNHEFTQIPQLTEESIVGFVHGVQKQQMGMKLLLERQQKLFRKLKSELSGDIGILERSKKLFQLVKKVRRENKHAQNVEEGVLNAEGRVEETQVVKKEEQLDAKEASLETQEQQEQSADEQLVMGLLSNPEFRQYPSLLRSQQDQIKALRRIWDDAERAIRKTGFFATRKGIIEKANNFSVPKLNDFGRDFKTEERILDLIIDFEEKRGQTLQAEVKTVGTQGEADRQENEIEKETDKITS